MSKQSAALRQLREWQGRQSASQEEREAIAMRICDLKEQEAQALGLTFNELDQVEMSTDISSIPEAWGEEGDSAHRYSAVFRDQEEQISDIIIISAASVTEAQVTAWRAFADLLDNSAAELGDGQKYDWDTLPFDQYDCQLFPYREYPAKD